MRFDPPWNPVSRRTFLRQAGIGAAAYLVAPRISWTATPASELSRISRMEFDVSYRTRIIDLPRDAEELHVWMPLPPNDSAQQIQDLTIRCPRPYETTYTSTFHNEIAHVRVAGEIEPFDLEASYRVVRMRTSHEKGELSSQAAQKYLGLTRRVRITPEVEAFASNVVGSSTDTYEIGRRVFHGINDLLFYDKQIPGCGTGDTAWIMRHKRGKCDDYHALFMAVMISRGIPVRWEQGFPLPLPIESEVTSGQLKGDCTGAHCWVSFFDSARGWVPVDVSEGDKVGAEGDFFFGNLTPNRFKVSEGRAIVLNPAQGGDPLSSFAFAYAEADGIPLIYGANYENIINFEITHVEVDPA
jgi:transglutaminase-like putative cysteine protease